MRGKRVFVMMSCLVLLGCSFVYAKDRVIIWKEFRNESGKVVKYPVMDSEISKTSLSETDNGNIIAPEAAEIGDVFLGTDGYERVIAVSEDGAFVTEIVP